MKTDLILKFIHVQNLFSLSLKKYRIPTDDVILFWDVVCYCGFIRFSRNWGFLFRSGVRFLRCFIWFCFVFFEAGAELSGGLTDIIFFITKAGNFLTHILPSATTNSATNVKHQTDVKERILVNQFEKVMSFITKLSL